MNRAPRSAQAARGSASAPVARVSLSCSGDVRARPRGAHQSLPVVAGGPIGTEHHCTVRCSRGLRKRLERVQERLQMFGPRPAPVKRNVHRARRLRLPGNGGGLRRPHS